MLPKYSSYSVKFMQCKISLQLHRTELADLFGARLYRLKHTEKPEYKF